MADPGLDTTNPIICASIAGRQIQTTPCVFSPHHGAGHSCLPLLRARLASPFPTSTHHRQTRYLALTWKGHAKYQHRPLGPGRSIRVLHLTPRSRQQRAFAMRPGAHLVLRFQLIAFAPLRSSVVSLGSRRSRPPDTVRRSPPRHIRQLSCRPSTLATGLGHPHTLGGCHLHRPILRLGAEPPGKADGASLFIRLESDRLARGRGRRSLSRPSSSKLHGSAPRLAQSAEPRLLASRLEGFPRPQGQVRR